MVNLLLSPQGRIPAGPFWQGVIILIVIGWVLGVVQAFVISAQSVSLLIGLVSLALIYPSVCVYAKRFHDSGRSGWWYLAVFGVQFLFGLIIAGVLAANMMSDVQGAAIGTPEWQSLQQEVARRNFLPTQLAGTVLELIIAFVVARLRSDPGENRFGPAPAAAIAA